MNQCFILLPCHSLEDFPVYHTGKDAQSILANWTILWHPKLISRCGKIPQWFRVEEPPAGNEPAIVLVPTVSSDQLPTGYAHRLERENSFLISDQVTRSDILEALKGTVPLDDQSVTGIEDFYSLGYVYLQVQLMARMLRYTSYLDEGQFESLLLEAAQTAQSGGAEATREKLFPCFDLLQEERNRFYPMEAMLVDLTLVASTTAGSSLRMSLEKTHAKNFLIDGQTLETIFDSKPETRAALLAADSKKNVFVSGQYSELPSSLLSIESLLNQVKGCQQSYQSLLNRDCQVFARRRFGLGNRLPGILHHCGFVGAVHATLDDGSHPEGSHPNIRWEGIDGETINAIGRVPYSAESADAFLNLGVSIGEALDSAHTATAVFAHWPGRTCEFYQDLIRSSSFGNILGTFLTLDEYFAQVDDPGYGEEFSADQYQSPFLAQSVEGRVPNPISSCIQYWQREYRLREWRTWVAISECLSSGKLENTENHAEAHDANKWHQILADHAAHMDTAQSNNTEACGQTLAEQATAGLAAAQHSAARAINGSNEGPNQSLIILNPVSFTRRVFVNCPDAKNFDDHESIIARDDKANAMVLDLPPMGFVQLVQPAQNSPQKKLTRKRRGSKTSATMVEGLTLRNEFIEVAADANTGGIRSIHLYSKRGNVLSQQVSMRRTANPQSNQPASKNKYAKMVADSVQVKYQNLLSASIESRGQILDADHQPLANFIQSMTLVRGKSVVECELDLDPLVPLEKDPWENYFCLRLAWPNESASLHRSVNDTRNQLGESRFEAPQFVEIDDAATKITLLTGGIPYHRRSGYRKLDSLLQTCGETETRFRFGIAIDVKNSLQQAIDFATVPVGIPVATSQTQSRSGYLFFIDQKSIVATDWQTLSNDQGQTCGVQIRLLETNNRSGVLRITAPKDVQRCLRTDFFGKPEFDGIVEKEKAVFEYGANEFFQVQLFWNP